MARLSWSVGVCVAAVLAGAPAGAGDKGGNPVAEHRGELTLARHPVKLAAGKYYVIWLRGEEHRPQFQVHLGDDVVASSTTTGVPFAYGPVCYQGLRPAESATYTVCVLPGPGKLAGAKLGYSLRVAEAAAPVATERGTLTAKSPPDRLRKTPSAVHTVALQGGQAYLIDLDAPKMDPYLRVEDPRGTPLFEDDDGGEGKNSRLLFVPEEDGDYRLVATVFRGAPGDYTLTVRPAGAGK